MLPNKENVPTNLFPILSFFGLFLVKKQPKLTKNVENWQNPNRLMQFSEIWYVDASQQNKMLQKNFFGFRPILAVFYLKNYQN